MKRYNNVENLILLNETILEGSLAGFWDWDMVTNEEYLSPRFKEMFGYEDSEMENSQDAWRKIAFPEDIPVMWECFQNHINSKGKIPFETFIRYHHKNGSTVWVRCTGKVVKWSDKREPLRSIGCHVDITKEKELEIQHTKAIKNRDILLKEINHRVKNNMQLLISLSRLKQKKGKTDPHEIENSINTIMRAYEAIYKSDNLEEIEIGAYLDQIINPLIKEQHVKYNLQTTNLSSTIDFLIPIALIIIELLNNSLKHAFLGVKKPKINLSVSNFNNAVNITYRDNGMGFGTSFLQKTHSNNSFGLTIIKGLIEQLNGEIKLYDDKGAVTELIIETGSKNPKFQYPNSL